MFFTLRYLHKILLVLTTELFTEIVIVQRSVPKGSSEEENECRVLKHDSHFELNLFDGIPG